MTSLARPPILGILYGVNLGCHDISIASNCIQFGDYFIANLGPFLPLIDPILIQDLAILKRISITDPAILPAFYVLADCRSYFLSLIPCHLWVVPDIQNAARDIVSSWMMHLARPDYPSTEPCGMFIMFKERTPPISQLEIDDVIMSIYRRSRATFHKGMDVVVYSAPYSNDALYGTISTGIISNILNQEGSCLLIDAKVAPLSTGAPVCVYEDFNRGLCLGMVVMCALTMDTRLSSFSVVATLRSILGGFIGIRTLVPRPLESSIWNDDPLVIVSNGNNWGSGCLIDSEQGIILTNRHVTQDQELLSVTLKDESVEATLLFSTNEESMYDLSVIQIDTNCPNAFKLAVEKPVKGEKVYSLGYGLLQPNASFEPSWSRGIVSNLHCQGRTIQTSCSVNPGCSGGAIIRPNGELLGIIVLNLGEESEPNPTINCSISIPSILGELTAFLEKLDTSHLEPLNKIKETKGNLGVKGKL